MTKAGLDSFLNASSKEDVKNSSLVQNLTDVNGNLAGSILSGIEDLIFESINNSTKENAQK